MATTQQNNRKIQIKTPFGRQTNYVLQMRVNMQLFIIKKNICEIKLFNNFNYF